MQTITYLQITFLLFSLLKFMSKLHKKAIKTSGEVAIKVLQEKSRTISGANHSTPQPPASVPHFCYRRVPKTTLNSQRLKGAMLPCILLHATACQLYEFTLDLLHAQVIRTSITIDCIPTPPAPVQNFLPPPVTENTLA